MNIDIFKSKKYTTNSLFIKKILAINLTLEEFLMLTYFDNQYNSYLNIEEIFMLNEIDENSLTSNQIKLLNILFEKKVNYIDELV